MIGPALDVENHEAAHDQCAGDGERIEEVALDDLVEQQPENRRRQESDDQVEAEALRIAVAAQSTEHFGDLGAIVPAHRENCRQLDDDLEDLALLVGVVQEVAEDDQVAGGRDRQKFRQAFDDAEHCGLDE